MTSRPNNVFLFSFFPSARLLTMSLAFVNQHFTAIQLTVIIVFHLGKVVCHLPIVRDWLVWYRLRDPDEFRRARPDVANLETAVETTQESLARTDNMGHHSLEGVTVERETGDGTDQSAFIAAFSAHAHPSTSTLVDPMASLSIVRSSSSTSYHTAED